MGSHFGKLGKQLDNAVADCNSTMSSLESRVLVTVRKMTDLQVVDTTLEEAKQVYSATRRTQAPELVAAKNNALIALDTKDTDQVSAATATSTAVADTPEHHSLHRPEATILSQMTLVAHTQVRGRYLCSLFDLSSAS